MNELLALLKEAYDQIHEMWKVADDSVADYTLNLEIAMDFVRRALDTEDRLDVFKALQKAHDVLEREEESYEDEEQDGYDELVDRLKNALNGLNETVFMKESELKALVKAVLTEIYQEPHADEEGGIFGLFKHLASHIKDTRPELSDIKQGHEMAHKLVAAMITDIKKIIKATLTKKKSEFEESIHAFNHHSTSLIAFLVNWAQNIDEAAPDNRDEISGPMDACKEHLQQIGAQFNTIYHSLTDKTDTKQPNTINALKQFEHLNEIFASLKKSIDELFQIGLNYGYGKKK